MQRLLGWLSKTMRGVIPLTVVVVVVMAQTSAALAADGDGDAVSDAVDNCPSVANPFQMDHDSDGFGDLCDPEATSVATVASDLLVGSDDADTLDGLAGDDHLYGLGGDDVFSGSAGNDFLEGGGGDDTLTGGGGCDIFALDPAAIAADTITDFIPGEDRVALPWSDDDPSDDPLPPFTVTPTNAGAVVTFADSTVVFEGLEALPVLDTSPCAPPLDPSFDLCPGAVLVADSDPFVGTLGDDDIIGLAIGGYVFGDSDSAPVDQGGNDCITGGDGPRDPFINFLAGDSMGGPVNVGGADILIGGEGADHLVGDSATGDITTGGDDVLIGGAGDDNLLGEGIYGTVTVGGDDVLVGGAGNDNLYGDSAIGDVTTGGADTFVFDVTAAFGNDTIWDAGSGYAADGGADGATVVDAVDTGVDTLRFEGVASLAALDALSTVTDDGFSLLAIVFTDTSKTTPVGSIAIVGAGTSPSTISFGVVDALAQVEVITVL